MFREVGTVYLKKVSDASDGGCGRRARRDGACFHFGHNSPTDGCRETRPPASATDTAWIEKDRRHILSLLHARRNDMRRLATPQLLCLFYVLHRKRRDMHLLCVSTILVKKKISL
jgi:hypothetical protein